MEKKSFKYIFVIFGFCMEGFEYMRKVIIVDEIFLKIMEGGILIIVIAQDFNYYYYFLVINVVDGEKNKVGIDFL